MNFLHLDPIKNRTEYRREYLAKHTPYIPLDERHKRVKRLIDENFPDMHDIAKRLMLKYSETVSLENVPFVGNKTIEHRVLYNGPVFYNAQYRTPHVMQEDIRQEIDRLLIQDLIEPCESQFNNAYLPVAKKGEDGKLKIRLVLDLRKLNSSVKVDRLPLTDVQVLLNQLHGAKYMSTIDLCKGYLQIGVAPSDRHLLSFRFDNKCYCYKRMCFGLASASGSFIRLMNRGDARELSIVES